MEHSEEDSDVPLVTDSVEPQSPWILTQVLYIIIGLITQYGWPCLLLGVACGLVWSRYGSSYHSWRNRRREQQEAELYHKDPDLLLRRVTALENARLRMQMQYAEASREHAKKLKLREEEKRREKVEAWEAQQRGEGGRSIRSEPTPVSPVSRAEQKRPLRFRPEYNPLMGGGGIGYRASRRGGASSG